MNLKHILQLQQKFILNVLFLFIVFIWSLFSVKWNEDLFHSGGITTMLQILRGLFNLILSKDILLLAIESTWITLAYAVAGMSLAIIIAFIRWNFSIWNFN